MTEEKWSNTTDPQTMMDRLRQQGNLSERKAPVCSRWPSAPEDDCPGTEPCAALRHLTTPLHPALWVREWSSRLPWRRNQIVWSGGLVDLQPTRVSSKKTGGGEFPYSSFRANRMALLKLQASATTLPSGRQIRCKVSGGCCAFRYGFFVGQGCKFFHSGLPRWSFLLVPEGQLRIAQDFSPGPGDGPKILGSPSFLSRRDN